MRSRLALALAAAGLAHAAAGCATYSGSLARAQRAFEQGEHDRALGVFRSLEPDLERLSLPERIRYAYLRGMTDYRLGDRADARHWLALASVEDKQTPGALDPSWIERMNASLGDLNEEILQAADDANIADLGTDAVPLLPSRGTGAVASPPDAGAD